MVELRLQVRITLRSPLAFMRSIFFINLGSTYGPFLRLRDISYPPVFRLALALLAPPADNVLIRALVSARPVTQRRLAPRRLRAGHTDGRAPLTTTLWVSTRVHRGTTDIGTPTMPAPTASLTDLTLPVPGSHNTPPYR